MNMTKKTLALAVVAASVMASAPAMADLSGNVSATSNYLWRGLPQNGDNAAVQGGIDYSHASGAYVGTWTSTLGSANAGTAYEGYELDIYGGYKFNVGDVGLDVGVISYMYPVEDSSGADNDDAFNEIYLGGSLGAFSAKASYSSDVNLSSDAEETGLYLEAAYAFGPVSVHAGSYDFEDAEDYMDYSVSYTKDEFTFGLSNTDLDAYDDARVFVTYKKSLGL